jgi:predicted DNA-binding transcriptional regulator YafY
MRRADRLFRLVQVLRARRFATGAELASELGVSKRTVYRDVRDLEASGIPIRGEAGVGYQLQGGFELPPLTFSADEVEGLVLGARIVQAWGDEDLAAAAASAMAKVEAVLPEPLRRVLLNTALFAPGGPRAAEMAGEMSLLRKAISERRRMRFEYTRADGSQSLRTVRPLALYFWGTKWTLATWCEMRNDYRSFRPDRMGRVEPLDDCFDGSDGIGLSGFLTRIDGEAESGGSAAGAQAAAPRRDH